MQGLQAYTSICNSASDVLRTQQRHLYCDILAVVAKSCKGITRAGYKTHTDELYNFWLMDVLPLMFDKNSAVQRASVQVYQQGLNSLDLKALRNKTAWSKKWKPKIINSYVRKVIVLREKGNKYWHRIWCFLIQIVHQEMFRANGCVKTFLNILQGGLRNKDNKTRANSIYCWRFVIEFLFEYNELINAKLINLLFAPLKSLQAKCLFDAEMKFRAWWYFITQLGNVNDNRDSIKQYFNVTVTPFLLFCYDATNLEYARTSKNLPASEIYVGVHKLALPCLTLLLSKQKDDTLENCLRTLKLESVNTTESYGIIDMNVLQENWCLLASSALKALNVNLIDKEKKIEEEALQVQEIEDEGNSIQRQLLKNLMHHTLHVDIGGDLLNYMFTKFIEMLMDGNQRKSRLVVHAINILAAEGLTLDKCLHDHLKYVKVMKTFVALVAQLLDTVPKDVLQLCIKHILQQIDLKENWTNFVLLSEEIFFSTKEQQQENYVTFQSKLLTWLHLTNMLNEYFRKYPLRMKVTTKANVVQDWLKWPMQLYCCFARPKNQNNTNTYFNETFCYLWCELFHLGKDSPSREIFLLQIHKNLKKIITEHCELNYAFGELFNAFAQAIVQLKNTHIDVNIIGSDSSPLNKSKNKYCQIFSLVKYMLRMYQKSLDATTSGKTTTTLAKETIERCLSILCDNVVMKCSNSDVQDASDDLKDIILLVMKITSTATSSLVFDSTFLVEWKRAILGKISSHPNKRVFAKIINLFNTNNNKDNPNDENESVWSNRNEESKLIDRQNECMRQKHIASICTHIGMDTSQSQDNCLKPWPPKQIVTPQQQEHQDKKTMYMVSSGTNNPTILSKNNTQKIENAIEGLEELKMQNLNNKENESEMNNTNIEASRNATDNLDISTKTDKGDTNNRASVNKRSNITRLLPIARRPWTRQATKSIEENSSMESMEIDSFNEIPSTQADKLPPIPKGKNTQKSVNCQEDSVEGSNVAGLEENVLDCVAQDTDQLEQQSQQQSDEILTIATTLFSPTFINSIDINLMTPSPISVNSSEEIERANDEPTETAHSPLPPTPATPSVNINDEMFNVSNAERTVRHNEVSVMEIKVEDEPFVWYEDETVAASSSNINLNDSFNQNVTSNNATNTGHNVTNEETEITAIRTKTPLTIISNKLLRPLTETYTVTPIRNRTSLIKESQHDISARSIQTTHAVATATAAASPVATLTTINNKEMQQEGQTVSLKIEDNSDETDDKSISEFVTHLTTIQPVSQPQSTATTATERNAGVQQTSEVSPRKIPSSTKEPNYEKNDNAKEISPKRTPATGIPTTKFLSSPSGHRLLNNNNNTSPTIKSKCVMTPKAGVAGTATPHLTGRGAKLINMIRNKDTETNVTVSNVTSATANNKDGETMVTAGCVTSTSVQKQQQQYHRYYQSAAIPSTTTATTPTSSATIMDHNVSLASDLLEFCKPLPPPTASPSVSILKRKLVHDYSSDEFSTTSGSVDAPVSKRKKVSFHDPVSMTKEYIIDKAEKLSKSKKCLIPDNSNKSTSFTSSTSLPLSVLLSGRNNNDNLSIDTDSDTIGGTDTGTDEEIDQQQQALSIITPTLNNEQMNVEQALDIVLEKCSLNQLLGEYLTREPHMKFCQDITKFLINFMQTDPMIKKSILETLSERLPEDILDHACQENLAPAICERVDMDAIVSHICAEAKFKNERIALLKSVLNGCTQLSDKTALELIDIIMGILKKQD